jgi:phosphatidylinositol alpha-mannosyltransferase
VRIGIVSQSYYPRFGGVTEHVHYTALELQRRGHTVTIVTARFGGSDPPSPVPVERLGRNILIPSNGALIDFTLGLRLRQQLSGLLEAHRFDLVHTHCPVMPTLPVLAAQCALCPVVGTFHTDGGVNRVHDAFRDYLDRTVVSRLAARIAVSKTAAASAAHYYPGHYEIIPNGVDCERFHPDRAPFEPWRDPERINLLYVGRLDPRKGLDILLAAMPDVVQHTGGRARLLIVGHSPLRRRYEAAVPASIRAHVHFIGAVTPAELPRWYATADVFVSPAMGQESFGIVLLEAMASGCPVVASDIPGYRSVVTAERNGVLVPPGDPGALARSISALAEDPGRRQELARIGREHALAFAWSRVTDQIEHVYDQVLGNGVAAGVHAGAAGVPHRNRE